jgi:signal peptidase I
VRCGDVGSAHHGGAELTLADVTAHLRNARQRHKTRRSSRRLGIVRAFAPIAVVVLVMALAVVIVAEPVRVGSGSMTPTFHAGDQVLVEKLGRRAHHPHRRDVIAFHVPGSSGLLIKRVVAVAGDSVGLADGVLVVNGRQLRESFVDYNLMDATYFGPVQVPPRTVFVMGDNRSDSVDSRRFGAVPTKDVVGRVVLRIWPP